jgi:small GTP-binding protein
MSEIIKKKICLIGDFGVGKTSLIRRFVDGQFSEHYLSTVGVQISQKDVEVAANGSQARQKLRLMLWDLEGRTNLESRAKFEEIVEKFAGGSHGAIVVADLNRQETIDHLAEHLALLSSLKNQAVKVIVAFNKADLMEESAARAIVSSSELSSEACVLASYLTSAKTGENVEAAFQQLTKSLLAEQSDPILNN